MTAGTTYRITADYKALESLVSELTDPETEETRQFTEDEMAELTAWTAEIGQNFESKFNGIFKVYRNRKAEAEVAEAEKNALKAEAERLGKRAAARLNEAGSLKGLLCYAMDALKLKKIKTDIFSAGFQATRKTAKPVAGFFKPDEIPVEFLKRELSPSAVDNAVKEGRLYEKDAEKNPLDKGKLFYRDEEGAERVLKGVSYTGGETPVIR